MRTAAHDIHAPLVLAALVAALAAAPARADYAPRLDVTVDPPARSTPTALTVTVTQAPGAEPSRSFEVAIPQGFGVSLGGTACSPDQEAAFACPEASRMGLAEASTPAGAYTGSIFYGGQGGKLVVLLSNGGLFPQPLTLEGHADQGALAFDQLPDAGLGTLTLRFGGAPRALLTTPAQCGPYTFTGRFTSRSGAQATSASAVNVDGCTEAPPQISHVRVRPRIARVGRSAVVSFELSEDAAIKLRMRRVGHGGRRVVGALDGHAGHNRLAVATRHVRPGTYELALEATDPAGLQRTKTTRLRVMRRPRGAGG
jgi:hypothetical protein